MLKVDTTDAGLLVGVHGEGFAFDRLGDSDWLLTVEGGRQFKFGPKRAARGKPHHNVMVEVTAPRKDGAGDIAGEIHPSLNDNGYAAAV